MLHHAVQRTPYIALDFLLPRSVTKSIVPIQRVVFGTSRFHSQLPASSSRTTPQIASTQEIAHALSQIRPLPEAAASATKSQATLFNRNITGLTTALKTRNVPEASKIWFKLADLNLLGLLGLSQEQQYSSEIAQWCNEKHRGYKLSPEWEKLVTEIAIFTAVRGNTDGLKAYLLLLTRIDQAETIIRVFSRYFDLIKQKDPGTQGESNGNSANDETVTEPARPSILHQSTFYDTLFPSPEPPNHSRPDLPLVRPEILLCAVAAYAMREDFLGALNLVLQTRTRMNPNHYLPTIHHQIPSSLQIRLETYVRRLELGRLMARPSSLSRQLSNLCKTRSDNSLERLYKNVILELSDPNPWLTTSPSRDPGKTQVVIPDFAWASFLSAFLRCNRTDLAEMLWSDLQRLQVPPSAQLWTALIDGYGSLRMPQQVLGAWDIMTAQSIKPEVMTYRALIHALFLNGHPDDALTRFRAFQAEGKKVANYSEASALVVYNTVLHGLLLHSKQDVADSILQEMKEKGPTPDIVSYNTFLRYHSRKVDLKGLAAVLQKLDEVGLTGDVFTFSTVLSTLLKARSDALTIVLNLMESKKVEPNTAFYTTVIDHLMSQETEVAFKAALEILELMERGDSVNIAPNEITYTTILIGLSRAPWITRGQLDEYQRTLWDSMEKRGVLPTQVTYSVLFKACLDHKDAGGLESAMWYYRKMQKQRLSPGNNTWYTILHGLYRQKEWGMAMEVLKDIHQSGFTPGVSLANYIITYCIALLNA